MKEKRNGDREKKQRTARERESKERERVLCFKEGKR